MIRAIVSGAACRTYGVVFAAYVGWQAADWIERVYAGLAASL